MVLFSMLFWGVSLTFKAVDEILTSVTIQTMKATEQYFPVVLFIIPFK